MLGLPSRPGCAGLPILEEIEGGPSPIRPPHHQPGQFTAVKVMHKRTRQQPRLECGPWPGAELQIKTLGGEFSWKRGQCALDSPGRLPGGGMSFGRPWPQLRGEELGGLSRKEDQGRHGLRSNSEHNGVHDGRGSGEPHEIEFSALCAPPFQGPVSDSGDLETAQGSPKGREQFCRRGPVHPQGSLFCRALRSSRTPGRA